MKKSLVIYLLLANLFSCNKSNDISPETKQEVITTAKGTLKGSPITKEIGNTGGDIALPIAGAKVVVPAGAMLAKVCVFTNFSIN